MMRLLDWKIFKVGHCHQLERLTNRAAPWSFCQFPALVGVMTHPHFGHVIFDTGYSQRFFDATDQFPERAYRMATPVQLGHKEDLATQLQGHGIAAADVGAVILSHFHADHMAGLGDFPNAQVFCSKAGWEHMQAYRGFAAVRRGLIKRLLPDDFADRASFFEETAAISLPSDYAPFETGADLLGDGSVVAISLPGHAPGQYGLSFTQADGQRIFLIADASWSITAVREFLQPAWIAGAMLHHSKAYPETLLALHQLYKRNNEMMIVPSHCRLMQAQLVGHSHAG